MARHLRLWWRFVAQAFVRDTHYRAHAFSTVMVGLIQLVLALVPIWLLYGYTDDVHGWSQAEVVALVGLHQVMTGLLATFVAPNMVRMTDYLVRGDLDMVLVRPVSAQFFAMLRWVRLPELGNVVTGAVVLTLGLARAGATPEVGAVVQAVLLVGCGLVLLTCVWSALAFLAFWVQAVAPVSQVVTTILGAGRYPMDFFPVAVRGFLTFAFPVAFATTLPAQALGDGLGWSPVVVGLGLTVLAVAALRAYWRLGVRSYASASS